MKAAAGAYGTREQGIIGPDKPTHGISGRPIHANQVAKLLTLRFVPVVKASASYRTPEDEILTRLREIG
jgi:hypothetical protein